MLKQKMRNYVDECCFTCLIKTTFQVITQFSKKVNGASIYEEHVANTNREVIFRLAESGDCHPVRTKLFQFYWTLGDNMMTEKAEQVVFNKAMMTLEALKNYCVKEHIRLLAATTIPLEELNVMKLGDSKIQTEIEIKQFLQRLEDGLPRVLDSIETEIKAWNFNKKPNGFLDIKLHYICLPYILKIYNEKADWKTESFVEPQEHPWARMRLTPKNSPTAAPSLLILPS